MSPSAHSLTADEVGATPVARLLPDHVLDARAELPAALALADAVTIGEGMWLAVLESPSGSYTASPLIREDGRLRRAAAGDGAAARMLELLGDGERRGAFTFEPLGTFPADRSERAIETDQSNESLVIGENVLLKLFIGIEGGPHPAQDLPAHLAAVGFSGMPEPHGNVTWTARDPAMGVLLATAAAFLPQATDGWTWYRDLLLAYLDDDATGTAALAPASVLGQVTADLHLALATPSEVLPEPVGQADRDDVAAWEQRAAAALEEAVRLTPGDEGQRLRNRADRLRDALGGFASVRATPVTRIHGDLHVGQVLRRADDYAVTDFDGNPMDAPAERVAHHPPARDVASMLRSLDHLGRVGVHRRGDRHAAKIQRWVVAVRGDFLGAYRARLAEAGRRDLFDERLLGPFEVEEACREFVYASRFRPRWLYAPDLALQAMFPGDDDGS